VLTQPAKPKKPRSLAQKFKERILRGLVVRFHMSLMLTAVVASGVLSSKLLLMAGFHSLRLRYPIAVVVSYGVFLFLIRIWLSYVSIRKIAAIKTGTFDVGNLNFGDVEFSGGGSGDGVTFGGGSSGGGGASDVWSESTSASFAESSPVPAPSGGGGGGHHWGFDFDFDLDGDSVLVLIVLAVLILGIVFAGGYLVYVAPEILPEAAWQFALAGALGKIAKAKGDWMPGFIKSTSIPFGVVLILATALGFVAQYHCPQAVRLIQALNCPGAM
jgi:hypothetical protein